MKELESDIQRLQEFLEIELQSKKIEHTQKEMVKPGFWDDKPRAKKLGEELARSQEVVKKFQEIQKEYEDLKELKNLGEDVIQEINKFKKKVEETELEFAFKSKRDHGNAILAIHPGAGGTESCDWTAMLFRMYLKWCERRGFKAKVLQYDPGEVAGIKDVAIEIKGKNAYGWLKSETGVHRLVRISPFDSGGRRHTSFASCRVYPLIEDEVKIELKDDDLKIDTFRASGPGGQHVNTSSTAIRITHLPTKTVATCQSERSQFQNKQTALKVLKSRLYQLYEEEEQKKLQKTLPEKHEIGWSREIRSYVFCPYTLVRDHRTGFETHKLQDIMDGAIDEFMRAWLLKKKS